MRLTKKISEVATVELLEILAKHSPGVSTSSLSGTPKFHGERTLSNRQIIRLLTASGKTQSGLGGNGNRTYYIWTLKPTDADNEMDTIRQREQNQLA